MNIYCVTLNGPAPWGFRLQGGKDFNTPLTVSRLTPGGKAAQAGVSVGDWVVSIFDANAEEMTHVEAQNNIRAATDSLKLTLSRAFHQPGAEHKMDVLDKGEVYYEDLYPEAKHGLRLEPGFVPNDRSKKRLMEDTQDWQPRTGTTQSRSFRILAQLTGTDFMQDPDDENMKRSSITQSDDDDDDDDDDPLLVSSVHTVTSCPAKTKPVEKADSAHAPSCRPPWVSDPGFADRYRPDKTSTVVTQHQQPVQPTPLQNRSSILQAAQSTQSSSHTPLCAACSKPIRGRYVVALGRSWHPEEFCCSQCQKLLDEGGFFEEKGSVYCTKCYDNRCSPNCAKCKKMITGEVMHALKSTFHVQCFLCAACKMPIRNQAFYLEEGEPYCERDYEKMFGTKCHGCDFKIDAGDRFLEALGFSWHDTCFVCAICHINLEGKTFFSKKDKPLCKSHAFTPV
ncbi:hypothetical protein DNTS_031201 [Danionella cerebrum]|uniref:PDZ and LIM domain protein 7 n=1 Tax=Danionella cerebrum TaxID=2873325 RepID=A0A553MNB8_9TELE|nr:hypothetical protein DNTS_031201 [Danionella translucida]TRY54661.1 hypothetical protein DNTS_031201 [Danionella translucida]